MNKDVILSIRGQQTFENEEPEVIELVTEGRLTGSAGGYDLSYQESELTGLGSTLTTFRIEDGRVTLTRAGQVNSQMVFEEGRRHISLYNTPYGALEVGINTRRMKVRLDDAGGDIEIGYALEIDHAVAGENYFSINVRERSGRMPPQ